MNKTHFLALNEVQLFIEWQTLFLAQLDINLQVKRSIFVPNGINMKLHSIESVLAHYMWTSSWTDWQTHQIIESGDWLSTQKSLGLLRQRLREAVCSGDEQNALKACLAVLQWGGVNGSVAFLQRKARNNQLVHYLTQTQRLLTLNGEQHLEQISTSSIGRYDSGLSKIFALLDESGIPMYDSRVGAMIGYCRAMLQRNLLPLGTMFNFPTGQAHGQQVRNAGELNLNFPMAPEFYSQHVSHHSWAQYQVKLGWIMQEILNKGDWFKNEGDLTARCHALEACFFMCGYDLKNICDSHFFKIDHSSKKTEKTNFTTQNEKHVISRTQVVVTNHHFTWIPTKYSLYKVITQYITFRKQTIDDATVNFKEAFLQFLQDIGLTENTAHSYCFPLSELEFDLFDRPIDELEIIAKGKQKGLEAAFQHRNLWTDERMNVSMVNVFLIGKLWSRTTTDSVALLRQAGFADTDVSARAILFVGQNVGTFFGLLNNKSYQPTDSYDAFFGDSYHEIQATLNTVL